MAKANETIQTPAPGNEAPGKLDFQEVEVRRHHARPEGGKTVVKFEVMKIVRPRVRISRLQADEINSGRWLHETNGFFLMYLLPGEKVPDKVSTPDRAADYYEAVGRERIMY